MAKEIYQPHTEANLMPMQSPGSARSEWMRLRAIIPVSGT
jgi:hypothetical protein